VLFENFTQTACPKSSFVAVEPWVLEHPDSVVEETDGRVFGFVGRVEVEIGLEEVHMPLSSREELGQWVGHIPLELGHRK
jgi:hypothetical protein